MMTGIGPVQGREAPSTEAGRLRQATRQLEGVFISQLYKAMRATVPEGGLLESSPGQDVFTAMFDEQMADALAQRLKGSIGDQLFAQMQRAIERQNARPATGEENSA